jgi:hypothetical protein
MSLYDLTLTAILSLAGAPSVDVAKEQPRLERFAAAIVHAVDARADMAAWMPGSVVPLPFKGPEARAATALALVAIAFHESGFNAKVSDCRRLGAFEPSITAFQLHGVFSRGPYTMKELCRSPRLAAERALYVFSHHAGRCRTPLQWHSGYAGGNCGRAYAAAKRQCAIWERLTRAAGLTANCSSAVVRAAAQAPRQEVSAS